MSSDRQTDSGEWDRVVENETVASNLVVTPGEQWLIGSNVKVEGNVLVEGSGTMLAMRPGSSLKLVGADPEQYVGGNDVYSSVYENDIGIWVWGGAKLDIRGTPKATWNRTGTDPTWEPDDEYWIAPTDVGDLSPRRWYPGDPIPQVDPRVPAAEIVNVTRDVVIEGPGHIHIHSSVPQRIEYARLEGLGVFKPGEGQVLGRYALHHHHGGDGAAGSIWRGLAFVNSRGRGMVPHMSHGITIEDVASVNSYAEGLWWDLGDDTNDLLVDHMAVLGVNVSREVNGGFVQYNGFTLGSGVNMEIRNSVAAGVRGSKLSVGFRWITGGKAPNPIWKFDTGNVAHNNRRGLRFWTNLGHEHDVSDYVSYRNQDGGIENGAYQNRVSYYDSVLLDDFFFQQSNTKADPVQTIQNVYIDSPREAMRVGHRSLPPGDYARIVDATLLAGDGYPKVYVQTGNNPWKAHFIRSGVTPEDFEFESLTAPEMQGTSILIDHEDGQKWEIRVRGGQKIVRERS